MSTAKDEPETGFEWAERADSLRKDGKLASAADHYATAAYAHLGEGLPTRYCKHHSWALYRILVAGVCYRMTGHMERCRNRCRQGVLVARDTAERVSNLPPSGTPYDQARRGAWHEYVGDLRLVGGLDGVEEAYERAEAIYRNAGDPSSGFAEQEHMRLHDFFRNVAFERELDAAEWQEVETESSLTTWVDYKRSYLPKYLEKLYQQDEWNF